MSEVSIFETTDPQPCALRVVRGTIDIE
jgi:hypothetical protein